VIQTMPRFDSPSRHSQVRRRARLHAGKRCCAWLALCSAFGSASSAAARDPERGAALNWVRLPGAETCIAAGELAERVERRLERSLFVVDSLAVLSVDGAVQPAGPGFAARLALSDRAGHVLGERVIQSPQADCRTLDEAVVLVIALTLSPRHGLLPNAGIALDAATERMLHELFQDEPAELDSAELTTYSVAHEPRELEPPTTVRKELPVTSRSAAARGRLAIQASAAGVLALGQLPSPAPGIEVALTFIPSGFWPLRLAASYLSEQTQRAATLKSGEARFGLNQATLGACPWHTDGVRLRLQVCAGLALGLVHVAARGFATGSPPRSDVLFDGQAQFDLQLRAGGALLLLGAALAVPFIQRSYTYQDLDGGQEQLFRTPQLSARLGAGLGVVF
jgi:hypothetical protein